MIRLRVRMFALWMLMLCVGMASAQNSTCPTIVSEAFARADEFCTSLGRNEACYGNILLDAEPQPDVQNFQFVDTGDIVDLADIFSLNVSPLDELNQHWGVAVLSLQANIPNTLPGQNVTFILFGDVRIEADNERAQTPMQAFYLRTGIGDAACEEAPESGLLVQTPDGVEEITFTVNGIDVQLGSTAYIQAQPDGEMTFSTIEGTGVIHHDGAVYPVIAGTWVRMRVDGDMQIIEPPTLPQGYENRTLQTLPLNLLPRPIAIVPALEGRVLERLHERLLSNNLPCGGIGLPSCATLPRFLRFGRLPLPQGWTFPTQPRPDNEADRDGDGFNDSRDACPLTAGLAEYRGCPPPPDRDGDGFNDRIDRCPFVFGTVNGCPPDRDVDGVPDAQDRCPDEAGTAANGGCLPEIIEGDADGDGVGDTRDACPTVFGVADNEGCPLPDRDGDGLPDAQDHCPSDAGPDYNSGCPLPDSDGDGVLDLEDECPDLAGSPDNFGCPVFVTDSDDDGFTDDVDLCPEQYAPDSTDGCPLDRDQDGFPDDKDLCPADSAPDSTNGCPPDTDDDGVLGSNDLCPDQYAPNSPDGCPPDRDGDGFPDDTDECPDKGDQGYGVDQVGCPLPPPT